METYRTIMQAPQGSITLELPPAFRRRTLEVVVKPLDDAPAMATSWPADFFTGVAGAWEGDALRREPQGSYETRGTLD